jgi:cell wall-associated protease
MDFTVTPLSVTNLTADKTSPQLAGTTILFTATTAGGVAPIQYKWWVFNGAGWLPVQHWSTNNTYSWTPTAPGNFKFVVWVRSSGNSVDATENNAYGIMDFTVTPLSVTNLTAEESLPQVGTMIFIELTTPLA